LGQALVRVGNREWGMDSEYPMTKNKGRVGIRREKQGRGGRRREWLKREI